ncbi:MAG: anaerobic ribonucleoside-triphosphate reductase activating protein [Bacillota bacterium]|nr:anaerobic ribonucleoside-triphosphate reductase activating protein [Bacillota bacterium]
MAESIRLAGIMRESIVDGPGIRFAIFCQGCPHDCPGCHNPETHDFAGGYDCSIDKLLEEIDKDPMLSGVTFSGGEPMCQPVAFSALGKAVKERGKTITIFSGYTLQQLLDRARGKGSGKDLSKEERIATAELLLMADILIDGPYVAAKRDLTLQFRGSSNQRVIDMNKTRETGKICLWENS